MKDKIFLYLLFLAIVLFSWYRVTHVQREINEFEIFVENFKFIEVRKSDGFINSRSPSVAILSRDNEIYAFAKGGYVKKFLKENVKEGQYINIYFFDACGRYAIRNIFECDVLVYAEGQSIKEGVSKYKENRMKSVFFYALFCFVYFAFLMVGFFIEKGRDNEI